MIRLALTDKEYEDLRKLVYDHGLKEEYQISKFDDSEHLKEVFKTFEIEDQQEIEEDCQ